MQPSLVGATIGNYVVKQVLGTGGMGAVYLAEHTAIGHKAAIKVLKAEVAAEPEAAQRFFNEARAVNLVKHSGIVQIFDYGQAPGVGAYLVMEYLEGHSLGHRLREAGRLEPEFAVDLLVQVCSAVGAAHWKGLIHRDLKPDNIYLVPDDTRKGHWRTKVLDFGIAKLLDAHAGGLKTQSGTMVGTPLYMAPEYAYSAKNFDHRIDIYSLGIIAYELLAGRPPFKGEGYGEILMQHMTADPVPLRKLVPSTPQALAVVVSRALAKDPKARYATMQDFGVALERALDGAASDAAALAADRALAADQGLGHAQTLLAVTPSPASLLRDSLMNVPAAFGRTGALVPAPGSGPATATAPGPGSAAGMVAPASGSGAVAPADAVAPFAATAAMGPAPVALAATAQISSGPPSTLSVSAAEVRLGTVVVPRPGRSRVGLFAALGAVLAVGGAGAVWLALANGGGDDSATGGHEADEGSPDEGAAGEKRLTKPTKRDDTATADTAAPASATAADTTATAAAAATTAGAGATAVARALSDADVAGALADASTRVEECSAKARKDTVVSVGFDVPGAGVPEKVAVAGAHAKSAVGACVTAAVGALRFPPHDGAARHVEWKLPVAAGATKDAKVSKGEGKKHGDAASKTAELVVPED